MLAAQKKQKRKLEPRERLQAASADAGAPVLPQTGGQPACPDLLGGDSIHAAVRHFLSFLLTSAQRRSKDRPPLICADWI